MADKGSRGVLVVGLGRFGGAMARTLMDLGHDVLAIDEDPRLVQRFSTVVTSVAQVDSTSRDALTQIGAGEFHYAVVAIGADVEASILTTAELSDLGVENIWAKAMSDTHARILTRVGAHHVVLPEQEMGERVAHLVTGLMADYVLVEDDFAMMETSAPTELFGKTLEAAHVRDRYGITVVGWKARGQHFTYATPETTINAGDTLLVVGDPAQVDIFARLP
jgi:trk system potassium uptake protein TrkA